MEFTAVGAVGLVEVPTFVLQPVLGDRVNVGWEFVAFTTSVTGNVQAPVLGSSKDARQHQIARNPLLADEYFQSLEQKHFRGRFTELTWASDEDGADSQVRNPLLLQNEMASDAGGSEGADVLVGGDGEDLVVGVSGSDLLVGGIGAGHHATDDVFLELFGD